MTTDYNKQAEDFLQATNTTLEVKEAEHQTQPQWEQGLNGSKHIKYTVTLKNNRHSYTFDFWGSIADWEKVYLSGFHPKSPRGDKAREEVKPTAYDILACLSPMYEDNFEDFCIAYGYDTDSRTAEATYKACIEQDRNLRKLFTHDEIDQLEEIN